MIREFKLFVSGRPCKERLIEIMFESTIDTIALEDHFMVVSDIHDIPAILRQQLSSVI